MPRRLRRSLPLDYLATIATRASSGGGTNTRGGRGRQSVPVTPLTCPEPSAFPAHADYSNRWMALRAPLNNTTQYPTPRQATSGHKPTDSSWVRLKLNFVWFGMRGMGVVSTLSIMPYSMACLGSIHLLRDNSLITRS